MPRAFAPHFPETEPGMNLAGAPPEVRAAAVDTSWLLEAVREQVRVPLDVTSLYRSPTHNAATPGASDTSQHMDGTAADFVPVGISLYTFATRFIAAENAGKIPLYGQLIFYPFTARPHVHISLPTRASRRAKLVKAKEGAGFVSFSLSLLRAGIAGAGTVAVVMVALLILARKGA